jgi:hypothetical protein
MKKDVFQELKKPELIDAVTYFPSLSEHKKVKPKLDIDDFESIKLKRLTFNALAGKEKVIELIKKYFDLKKYGDLNRLSKLDWATQLIDRKRIIDLLGSKKNTLSTNQLQKLIFKLLLSPIASSSRFSFYSQTTNINDLSIGELYSISKAYQEHGFFEYIDDVYKQVDHELNEDISQEGYDLISKPIDLGEALDTPNIIVTSINLSVNDQQLVNEFKKFIKIKRANTGLKPVSPTLKGHDTQALINHSVLQYLDLKMITTYISSDKPLTDGDFINFIFPTDHTAHSGALDKFRSSTKPRSKTAITQRFIDQLLSEENKKQIIFKI